MEGARCGGALGVGSGLHQLPQLAHAEQQPQAHTLLPLGRIAAAASASSTTLSLAAASLAAAPLAAAAARNGHRAEQLEPPAVLGRRLDALACAASAAREGVSRGRLDALACSHTWCTGFAVRQVEGARCGSAPCVALALAHEGTEVGGAQR